MDNEKLKSFRRKISAKKIQKSFRKHQVSKKKRANDALARFLTKLNDKQKEFVENQFKRKDDVIYVKEKKINLTGLHLKKLKPGQSSSLSWLSSEIIDAWSFYLASIHKNCFYLDSAFLTKLLFFEGMEFNDFKRHLKKSKKGKYNQIFKFENIFLPIHIGENHWALMVLKIKDKKILYLDSLESRPDVKSNIISEIWSFFSNCSLDKDLNEKLIDYHVEEWRVDEMIKSPQQNNSIDCGVFLCANMFYISNGFIPTYTQKDIPSIRYRIAFTLLQNYLQTEVTEIV